MSLCCLTDPNVDLVADASTAINLNASGYAREILSAIPNALLVTDVVLGELSEDSRSGRRDAELFSALVDAGLVRIVSVDNLERGIFERLVTGRSIDTLDDGEAATIAYAVETGATAIIDERKANKICRTSYPQLALGCTVDIFCHDRVRRALGDVVLGHAVFNAMQGARMRVLPRYLHWVVGIVGRERAAICESLPRSVRISNVNEKR